MVGSIKDSNLKGIIPRCLEQIFEHIECEFENYMFEVTISFIQIYMEMVKIKK
jgi:hypothetical protein